MASNFTEKANQAIVGAAEAALRLGHDYVGTEHLLLGLSKVEGSVASKALILQNATEGEILKVILETAGAGDYPPDGKRDYTPRVKKILEQCADEARKMGVSYVGTEHILLSLIKETDCVAVGILAALNVNGQRLHNDIMGMLGVKHGEEAQFTGAGAPAAPFKHFAPPKNSGSGQTPTLNQFGRDFTQLAKEGKFDPIIGRETEIGRVIQILSRRTKNNPCLVGDPGVGKTAVAEGLAARIAEGQIPETLKNKRVISLDLSLVVAGTKYRGEFEERVKRILNEVKNSNGSVIMFIDELHTLIGAGGAEGSLDASNILKPALSRGEMQVIGATTLGEYRKYIEKDAALERRFQPVTINEPTEAEACQMLFGLRDKYEAHHNVKITDDAVKAAVYMSNRYITDRFLPDKAIDLLDEAASKVRLKGYTAPPNVKELEERLKALEVEKEEAIKAEEFEKASAIKQEQNSLAEELDSERGKWKNKSGAEQTVGVFEIAGAAADWTGIPVTKLRHDETLKLLDLEQIIHKRVIGQNEAVSGVARAIRAGRVGLKNPKRPIGTFLFLGPTGVGKTELSKALADALFGTEDAIIRVDMSEYMEKHSVSKLIGAPPGYVGFEEGGQLSEKVRRKPYSVVLFDEIEKAHSDVFNLLLQVLDDGHITDAQGRKINFKNTIIIMTSNAGAKAIISPKKLGFASGGAAEKTDYETMKKAVLDEIKQIFKPEFINRIDEIIVFHALSREHVAQITALMAAEFAARVKTNAEIELRVSDDVINHIAETDFDPHFGARPLARAISAKIEDPLSEKILEGAFSAGDTVSITFADGACRFERVDLNG